MGDCKEGIDKDVWVMYTYLESGLWPLYKMWRYMEHYRLLGVRKYQVRDQIKSVWTDIGIAMMNKDGSFTLRFNYIPIESDTKIILQKAKEVTNDN